MNRMKPVVAMMCLLPALASAAGSVDLTGGWLSIDSDVAGVRFQGWDAAARGRYDLMLQPLFLTGELAHGETHKTLSGVSTELDLEQGRVGLGYALPHDFYVRADYAHAGFRYTAPAVSNHFDLDGAGLHGGGSFNISPSLAAYAELGYLHFAQDAHGPEFVAGAKLRVGRVSLLLENRYQTISDSGAGIADHFRINTLRAGLSIPLGEHATGKPVATLDLPASAAAAPLLAPAPSAAAVAPAPALNPASAAAAVDEMPAVSALVERWINAWSARDAATYLACYAPDFRPEEKHSRGKWEQERRERLKTPRNIKLSFEHLQWQQDSAVHGRATLLQHYRSHSYSDDRRKVLELEKVNGSWLIVREFIP